jgi:mono/diheme cytochrome c family protein
MHDRANGHQMASPLNSEHSMQHQIQRVMIVLLALSAGPALAETPQQRGEVIARGLCSPCHAIGKTDKSKLAAAPAFRDLDKQTNLSKLSRRIQEGLLTGHEDMPLFRAGRGDADAMVAYIRSVQGP